MQKVNRKALVEAILDAQNVVINSVEAESEDIASFLYDVKDKRVFIKNLCFMQSAGKTVLAEIETLN